MSQIKEEFSVHVSSSMNQNEFSNNTPSSFKVIFPQSFSSSLQNQTKTGYPITGEIQEVWKLAVRNIYLPKPFEISCHLKNESDFHFYATFQVKFYNRRTASKKSDTLRSDKKTFVAFERDDVPSVYEVLSFMKTEINSIKAEDLIRDSDILDPDLINKDEVELFNENENVAFDYLITSTDRIFFSLRPDLKIFLSPELGRLFNCQIDSQFYFKSMKSRMHCFGYDFEYFDPNLPENSPKKIKDLALYHDFFSHIFKEELMTMTPEQIKELAVAYLNLYHIDIKFDLSVQEIAKYSLFQDNPDFRRNLFPIGLENVDENYLVPKVIYLHTNLVSQSLVGKEFVNILKSFPMNNDRSTLNFTSLDFHQVATDEIMSDNIYFEFRDQNQRPMLFKNDNSKVPTIISLEFRKCMKRI